MKLKNTDIDDLKLIHHDIHEDMRGYFIESFRSDRLIEFGITDSFIQDNLSRSCYGTIRGLHFQIIPFEQSKLIRSVYGSIIDTVVDLRPSSKTFLDVFQIELNDLNNYSLYIPSGCAHGFSTISEEAIIYYKTSNYFSKEHEFGVNPYDESLSIDWNLSKNNHIISDKDKALPSIAKLMEQGVVSP